MNNKRLAICVPTYNRWDIIEELFRKSLNKYTEVGFDVYIYDSSDNNRTQYVTNEWQASFHNLYYVSMPPEIHSNMKVYKIFQQLGLVHEYDYIWVCGDAIRWDKKVVQKISDNIANGYDIISINYRDVEKIGDKEYSDANDIFHELAWHFTLYGAVVLNTRTILGDVNWDEMIEKYDRPDRVNFSHVGFYFEKLAKIDNFKVKNFSFTKYVLTSSVLKTISGWTKDAFFVWGIAWPNIINALPEMYTDKAEVIKKNGINAMVLDKESFLQYRLAGILNIKKYIKYKNIWKIATYFSERKIFVLSITPAFIINFMQCIVMKRNTAKNNRMMKIFCEKYKNIYIFGAGGVARTYALLLQKMNIEYKGFVVSDLYENSKIFLAHNVFQLDKLDFKKGESGLIIALNPLNYEEIKPKLQAKGIDEDTYYFVDGKRYSDCN